LGKVILVSTPWALYNRPSIQLGALKAYLRSCFPGLDVQAFHLYLQVAERIGYGLYQAISERTWLAETVYAALLFPERSAEIKKVFSREGAGDPVTRKTDFEALTSRVREVSEAVINGIDWGNSELIGFSISLCQLTSGLYFIRRIKQGFPDLKIVVGGSTFAGDSARGLLEAFSEVDFVVNGEGELPLGGLVDHIRHSGGIEGIPHIPGLLGREGAPAPGPVSFCQMQDLGGLPLPDYDDYFNLLKTFRPEKTFFPTLCAEISRGCWWGQRRGPGGHTGCAFCNLNLQWEGYRSKGVAQAVSEIDHLTSRYKLLSVAITDNLLPVNKSTEIFQQLGGLNKDLYLFGEIRATTPRRVLEAMRAGGVREIQIGIEALSSSLLVKLNKGTTAIQNLEIMKHCEELGIKNVSNIILCFPGSDEQDVAETLHTLEFAFPFRPLRFVQFWLGLGSPVWSDPCAYGLRAVFNHRYYSALFPPDISASMRFIIQDYRGNLGYLKKIWQPVKSKMRAWKKAYAELHRVASCGPTLSYRDGRDFLIIRQRRIGGEPLTHRLVGTSRAIYLFCRTHRTLRSILGHFPGAGEEQICRFLTMMVDKRLMFEEKRKYLSLAVPADVVLSNRAALHGPPSGEA
jgi:ribosomal peptide maturation radical SAM protein 1